MTVVVFSGPTISAADVRAELEAEVRPPAARGDVLAAALERPSAIAIIDGYFDRVPSVWHKEILWAMREGIHVFGSSSMGALRAAELAPFGMEGFGLVFEHYRDGLLTADDEVAVTHGLREQHYRPLSEALVNVRATLAAAVSAGVASRGTSARLESVAKRLPYPERTYAALFSGSETQGMPPAEIDRLRDWVVDHRVDQKRLDALAMLSALREREQRGWRRKEVSYQFACTGTWDSLFQETTLRIRQADRVARGAMEHRFVLEEALVGGQLGPAYSGGLARAMCLNDQGTGQPRMDPAAVAQTAEAFRRERGLMEPAQFERWLEAQGLREGEVDRYFVREAQVRRVAAGFHGQALAEVVDSLRAAGGYEELATRADAKRRALAAKGLEDADLRDTTLSEEQLWRWYFEDRLGRAVPPDLRAYAGKEHAAFESLRAAVIREYCYLNLKGSLEH